MNLAFGISEEDLEAVLAKFNKLENLKQEEISGIFFLLDLDAIEKAALYSTDFDEQVSFAYLEIEEQLKQNGILWKLVFH